MFSSSNISSSLYILCSGFAFSLVNILAQYLGYSLSYPSTAIALFQYSFAFAFLLPWFCQTQGAFVRTKRPLWHIGRVSLAIIGIQLWLKALAWPIPIWQGIALLTTSPLFATIGAGLFLKEQVSLARILACLIGFIGAMIILAPWEDAFSIVALLPIGAALCWAGYALMVKKQTQTESPQALVFYLMLGLLPMNIMLAAGNFQWPDIQQLGLLLAAGGLVAIGNYAVIKAYLCADAAYIQPFDFAKIPWNIILGWLVFGWVPHGNFAIGLMLILGAISFLWYKERHNNLQDKNSGLTVAHDSHHTD